VVTSGSASIGSAAGTTTITQSSANAIIHWSSFNVGAAEVVQFIQPSRQSVAVNQVLGPPRPPSWAA
jgi:large exoprotein involved in heme utilization and adhesion